MGIKTNMDGTMGTIYSHYEYTNIIDNNLSTSTDNWTGTADGRPVSFAGVIWAVPKYDTVTTVVLTLRIFGDGGWFGVPGALYPAGGIAATNLIEPVVQVTTDWGTNWIDVATTSDYQTVMLGKTAGASVPATFTLTTPVTKINGIRVLGSNGGNAGADPNGFLGVYELVVNANAPVDADGDGMADAWEAEFAVSDPNDDPDFDGLDNLHEYLAGTNPGDYDTDGDLVADGDEVNTYFTNPLWPDSDFDGLTDGQEINDYGTNPNKTDTDGDGLTDGEEVNKYFCNPLLADSDGDLFPDRMEVLFGGNPASAAVYPDNLALIGTGIIGVKQSFTSGADIPFSQQGAASWPYVNDGNTGTRTDTYNGGTTTTLSYVGATWGFMVTNPIVNLDLTMATFGDGGWFGVNNVGPGVGGALTAAHLTEPIVQVTTDGGTTWTAVPFTSDYTNKLMGHHIGGGAYPNPSSVKVTFTLSPPATGINGVRIIGTEGGTASRGFLGVFEFTARKEVSDSDGDGMVDSWELINGLVVGVNDSAGDPDGDGLTNIQEFNLGTLPQVSDTDGDGLKDGDEVDTFGTKPLVADTDADGLTDGAEVITFATDPLDADSDDDGFADGTEVLAGTDPMDPSSYPSNLALMRSASGIMGTKMAIDTAPGALYGQSGVYANINDGDLNTRIDTWNGGGTDPVSFVGILWTNLVTKPISRLDLTLATFWDGGWFGLNNSGPGWGGALPASDVREPTVQATTDGGASWFTVSHASDYMTTLTGHIVGGGTQPNPSSVTTHFIFVTPLIGVNGIRIIGTEGGTASGGFLGVFELAALSTVADTDGDGMNDDWEILHGLIVGVNDSADDPDGDGLPNGLEFANNTDPHSSDTDGDTLKDGDEVSIYHTNPTTTDTDNDGLSDDAEIASYLTDPTRADTDSDGFDDGLELTKGTDPKDNTSHPANYAFAGTGILGTAPSVGPDLGTLVFNSGVAGSINDGDPATRVDSYSDSSDTNSFVGIIWHARMTNITGLDFTLATFFDGGWFGVNNIGPGSGSTLSSSAHLLAPEVQVTKDGGATWSTVGHTSDYMTALDGHPLPSVDFGPPTAVTAHFTLAEPQTDINGIRIIGSEGGTASGGFLGVFELTVSASQIAPAKLLNLTLAPGQISFEFDSLTGVTYVVEYKNKLDDTTWQTLKTITGDGTRQTVTDSTADDARFYRVLSK